MHGNGLDLLPEEGVDEDENTLDDISGDEVRRPGQFGVLSFSVEFLLRIVI